MHCKSRQLNIWPIRNLTLSQALIFLSSLIWRYHFLLFYFLKILLIDLRQRKRDWFLVPPIHAFICPDGRSNPQPWHMGTMLRPAELPGRAEGSLSWALDWPSGEASWFSPLHSLQYSSHRRGSCASLHVLVSIKSQPPGYFLSFTEDFCYLTSVFHSTTTLSSFGWILCPNIWSKQQLSH